MLWLTVEMSVELQGDLVINDTTALPFAWMCFTDPISPFTKNLNPNPFQCLDLSWGRKD